MSLRELRVRNFAVIRDATIELGPGLVVLTGETGAGKSLLVGALALLRGGRPSASLIAAGEDRAVVEGLIDFSGSPGAAALLQESGIDLDEGWAVLRREIRGRGRHRAWINGSPCTAALMGQAGRRVLEIHGQHQQRRLAAESEQRRTLDRFGGHEELAADHAARFDLVQTTRAKLTKARKLAAEGRARADYLRFVVSETAEAEIRPGEDAELEAEERRLAHASELREHSGNLQYQINEADGSVLDALGQMSGPLEAMSRADDSAGDFVALHRSAMDALGDLARQLAAYRDRVEHDPGRLDEVRARRDRLQALKRKYGPSLEDVVAKSREAAEELSRIESADQEISTLDSELAAAVEGMRKTAVRLSGARFAAAESFAEQVTEALQPLGLSRSVFEVTLEPLDPPGRGGAEQVQFLVSTNPGFPPGSLSQVASGGEMSRLMLGIESVLAGRGEPPVMVFDEIDAGIGGEVAHRVARALQTLAEGRQVLAVTHLAQLASRADQHFVVTKRPGVDTTEVEIATLTGGERVREVARMLGGDQGSEVSRAHASEQLRAARR